MRKKPQKKRRSQEALLPDGTNGQDYKLRKNHDRVWVRIGQFSVCLIQGASFLEAKIYRGKDYQNAITSTCAYEDEGSAPSADAF